MGYMRVLINKIPRDKNQETNKFQGPNSNVQTRVWSVEIWYLFGSWYLGSWNLANYSNPGSMEADI